MIQIQQDMPETDNLEPIINRNCEVQISIDTDSVESDIMVLNEKLDKPMSKIDKKNIKEVKEYLEKLLRRVVDYKLEMLWSVDEHILKTYPIELKSIPEYNIEMTDYISVNEGRLVRVSYADVLELIAIEMMYREFDETMDTMEEKLKPIGITGIYPSSEVTKHFDSNVAELSKVLKIGDSPYYAREIKTSFEYFNGKTFRSAVYRDNVGHSIKHALAILAEAILVKLTSCGIDFKLCSVSESGIYFITTNNDVNIDNILSESAVVRVFGRKFEVKPKVTVF